MAPRSPSPTKRSSPARRRPPTRRPSTAKQSTPPPMAEADQVAASLPGFAKVEDPPMTADDLAGAGVGALGSPDPGPTPAPPTSDPGAFADPFADAGPEKSPARPWRKIDPATRQFLFEVAQAGLGVIGSILQLRFAHPDRYGPNTVYLPDRQDEETIGGALANLAARRVPEGLGGDNDAADIVMLAVGAGGYGVKNYIRRSALVAAAASAFSDLETEAEPVA